MSGQFHRTGRTRLTDDELMLFDALFSACVAPDSPQGATSAARWIIPAGNWDPNVFADLAGFSATGTRIRTPR
jgi:hypothetical protein